MWRRPACQTLSKALDILRATARVAPDLLKALAVLSYTTFRGSAVDWEDSELFCESGWVCPLWKIIFKNAGLSFYSKFKWYPYIVCIVKTTSRKIGASIHSTKFTSSEFVLYFYLYSLGFLSTLRHYMEYCCYVLCK